MVETGIEAIAADRMHGAGYLARKALGILALATPDSRPDVAGRLAELRPEMPAIAAAVQRSDGVRQRPRGNPPRPMQNGVV